MRSAPRPKDTEEDEAPYIAPVLPPLDQPLGRSATVVQYNYSDLIRLYYRTTRARAAVILYKAVQNRVVKRRLSTILRDHRQQPVFRADELAWREGFDHLLTCYSVLELSLQAGYITSLSPSLCRDSVMILQDASVRAYYEKHYPLLLPQLLRIRLVDGRAHDAHRGPRQLSALQRAIEVDRRLLARPDVIAFLTLADDFRVEGYDRSALVRAVSDPVSFIDHVTKRGSARTYLDHAVSGLLQFLHLCEGLQHVLRTLDGDARFQSGIWHLFGYWFADRREAVVPTLRTMIKQMQRSAVALPEAVALATPRQAQDLLECVNDLASARYGKPLSDVLLLLVAQGSGMNTSRSELRKQLIKAMKAAAKRTGRVQLNRKANVAVSPGGRVRSITREE